MKLNLMNDMFGIESMRWNGGRRAVILPASRALSGRMDDSWPHTQGIVQVHSALGCNLMAFQAIPHGVCLAIERFAAQRVARIQPKAERSDALGYGHPKQFAP